MNANNGNDTATTLIVLALVTALAIYLFGWTGVWGMALFVLCANFSPPSKRETLLGQIGESAENGCGIVVLIIGVFVLKHLCGC